MNRRVGLCLLGHTRAYSTGKDARTIIQGRFQRPDLGIPGSAAAAEEAAAAFAANGGRPPFVEPPAWRRYLGTFFRFFLPISGAATLYYGFTNPDDEPLVPRKLPPEIQYIASQQNENQQTFSNWSGTHEATPRRHFQPETESEVEGLLVAAARARQGLRAMGSGLSPNGSGLSSEGLMTMGLMDRVMKVDTAKKQVTVQAGARVQAVVDALAPHGLTLQNYASIREQQIGGYTQMGAHGTGARLPPVDGQVVGLRLATPALGMLSLSGEDEPELFHLAKVGLGALGVVTEVTLQCVPRHQLVEETFATTVQEVKKHHADWLRDYQHLRYMWVPHTDTVVVVRSNPKGHPLADKALAAAGAAAAGASDPEPAARLKPMRDLVASRAGEGAVADATTLAALRDAALQVAPTDKDWVAAVNKAEAACWAGSGGVRVGWSDQILGFDCGGQQWVMETCFPVGELSKLKGVTKDLEFMEALMKEIKANKIPAASPIEQRWSCGSPSTLSPAHGPDTHLFSWVGIIMYLPTDPEARKAVTDAFNSYARIVNERLVPRFNAVWHWAKLEAPDAHTQAGGEGAKELARIRARLAARYPLTLFNTYRDVVDPTGVLGNEWLDALLPRPPPPAKADKAQAA